MDVYGKIGVPAEAKKLKKAVFDILSRVFYNKSTDKNGGKGKL